MATWSEPPPVEVAPPPQPNEAFHGWASRWLPIPAGPGWFSASVGFAFAFLLAGLFWVLAPNAEQVTLISASLGTGILLVTPLGVARTTRPMPRTGWHFGPEAVLFTGLVAAAAANGGFPEVPAVMGSLWLVVSLVLLAQAIDLRKWRPVRDRSGGRDADVVVLAHAYLVVGAGWLLLHLMGRHPLGLGHDIVELTAVHFHFAGFGALLVARDVRNHTVARAPRLAEVALWTVAAGPLFVAAGWAAVPVLQPVGAVLLAVGLWACAWLTLRHVVPDEDVTGPIRGLLVVSSLLVLAPMVLAVQWALGNVFDVPALTIPQMARLHGITNAIGFTVPALLAWGALARLRGPAAGT